MNNGLSRHADQKIAVIYTVMFILLIQVPRLNAVSMNFYPIDKSSSRCPSCYDPRIRLNIRPPNRTNYLPPLKMHYSSELNRIKISPSYLENRHFNMVRVDSLRGYLSIYSILGAFLLQIAKFSPKAYDTCKQAIKVQVRCLHEPR